MTRLLRCAGCAFFGLLLLGATGCTSRGITVTSVPPGAEVSINHRVVGVTPIRVGFTHYGTYRIELRKEKHQVLVREEAVKPPVYGYDPGAAIVDNLVPARLSDEVYLHYVMKPLEEKKSEKADAGEKDALSDRDALMERALAARDGKVTHPKTGQQYEIALRRESSKTVAQATEAEGALIAGSDTKDKPTGLEPVVKDITVPQPKGVTLAKELNLDTPVKEKGLFKDPNEDKRPEPSKVIRTPKDEELIFDKPDLTEPEVKKAPKKK